jgi:xanthine dehydrogenase small subunit
VPDRSQAGVPLSLVVDGRAIQTADDGASLLEVLRDRLGIVSVKDGCSPQGQCGCCTVLVDGQPRVSCVTPARRVAGREITTLDGFAGSDRDAWAAAFCATGASQCGFCTPGIVVRLEALRRKGVAADDRATIDRALAAHLCRCTGWGSIRDAFATRVSGSPPPERAAPWTERDGPSAERRATLEGATAQRVAAAVALGEGGFADDGAPRDALVAVPDGLGGWVVAETVREARALAGKVQGRRTTRSHRAPIDVPDGDWTLTLQTSWVEPAYLETDASWCTPGGEPASALGNGGAFGGKATSVAEAAARRLADEHGRAVRVIYSREDTVRMGPKRPPLAAGVRPDGTGSVRVARTDGIAEVIHAVAPRWTIEEIDVAGPPTSTALRGAGWVEATVLRAGLRALADPQSSVPVGVTSPSGGRATAQIVERTDGITLRVGVACGDPLDEVVLRSYCLGAAHMAYSWVTSEALMVDEDGEVHDLTIRSFGVVAASGMPPVEIVVEPADPTSAPVNGSDAVFAAVAAATWIHEGLPPSWPTR